MLYSTQLAEACYTQYTACRIQHTIQYTACRIQHAIHSTQLADYIMLYSTQLSEYNMLYTVHSLQNTACYTQYTAFRIQHTIQYTAFRIQYAIHSTQLAEYSMLYSTQLAEYIMLYTVHSLHNTACYTVHQSWKKCWGVPGAKVWDLPVPEIFYTSGLHSTNCMVIRTKGFWTMGCHNTMLHALNGKYWLIKLFSQNIWLEMLSKHLKLSIRSQVIQALKTWIFNSQRLALHQKGIEFCQLFNCAIKNSIMTYNVIGVHQHWPISLSHTIIHHSSKTALELCVRTWRTWKDFKELESTQRDLEALERPWKDLEWHEKTWKVLKVLGGTWKNLEELGRTWKELKGLERTWKDLKGLKSNWKNLRTNVGSVPIRQTDKQTDNVNPREEYTSKNQSAHEEG